MRKWMLPISLCLSLMLPTFSGVALAAGPGSSGTGSPFGSASSLQCQPQSGNQTGSSTGTGSFFPPGLSNANGQCQPQSGNQTGSSTGAGSFSSPGLGSQAKGQGQQPVGKPTGSGSAFGQSVAAAVQAALSSGQTGPALANAVHLVIQTFQPNAKGIAVAEAVYQSVYTSTSGGQTPPTQFKDMGGAGWAAPYVDALTQSGVVQGTSKTTFSPNANVTGAELLTMLDRMQNWSKVGSAAQTGSTANSQLLAKAPAFALQAIKAALSRGTLQGVGGLANPNAPLTRAQAIMLMINSLGLNQTAQSEATASIPLAGPVPSWAHGAIALAIQLGLVAGSNGQILADQTLTRAQMAALLARLAILEALSLNSQSSSQ